MSDKNNRAFKALPIAPPPIWNGIVIISADCCVNGELIKAGTLMQVGPIPTTFFQCKLDKSKCDHDWNNDGCNPTHCLKCGQSFTAYAFMEAP